MMIRLLAIAVTLMAAHALVPSAAKVQNHEAPAARPATSVTTTYNVDPVHSSVIFRIKHMDVAYFYGRFNNLAGTVKWNDDDPAASELDMRIATASVDTANEGRNRHLRSDDFFSAEEHETIHFRTSSIEKRREKFVAQGELTLRGVTKPVTVDLEKTGSMTHPRSGKEVIGLHAEFTIKRSDFGMDYGVESGALGDEVKLMIGLEAGASD